MSKWKTDTLKEHLDALRGADQRAIAMALDAAERANAKAESSMNERLAGMNELRGAMNDQARTYIPRHEYQSAHEVLVAMVAAIDKRLGAMEGVRRGQSSVGTSVKDWAITLAAVAAIIIATANAFFGPRALPTSSPVISTPAGLVVQRQP